MGSTALLAFGYVVLFLSNTLSSSAGIGGGLLNVAIIHSIQGFGLKDAVVMSLAAIMGNTLVQLCINIRTRHPSDNKRSVIYWDMVAMMLPAELGGSNLGVILSSVMPSTIMYIGAVIVLMIGCLFTAKKARHLYELESERKLNNSGVTEKLVKNPISNDLTLAADGLANTRDARSGSNTSQRGEQQTRFPSLDAYLPEHTRRLGSFSGPGNVDRSEDTILLSPILPPMQVPWFMVGVIALVWTCYLALYVGMSFVPGCSQDWGILLVFIYLIVVVEVPWAYSHLTAQQKSDPQSIVAGDIHWSPSTLAIPLVTFSIGVLTALLGFGGGELIGPYLLQLRIQPLVSTATSGMMSFLNTALSLIHYAILGRVQFASSAALFALGAVAGLCGRLFSLFVVARWDRASALVFALVAILGMSAAIYVVFIAVGEPSFAFEHLC